MMGKGELGIKVCNWLIKEKEFDLKCIVPVIPEPDWSKSIIDYAKSKNITYLDSGNINDLDQIINIYEIDLFISIFFETILKRDFINRCKRIINFHPSPLPRYRGVRPINWFLKDNENQSQSTYAITLHDIDEGIDSGPIISQVSFPVYPEYDEVIDIYERCLDYGYYLIIHALRRLDEIIPIPQMEEMATIHYTQENYLLGDRFTFTKKISNRMQNKLDQKE